MKTFKNLIQLTQHFADEKVCKKHLEQLRWADGKPKCPHCGHEKVYNIESGKRFKCASNKCYKKFSVTSGTIFENTKIPLRIWFVAIYLACNHKKGISSCQLATDLGITQKTAWFVLHRIREMLTDKAPAMLEGTIEADETYVGGKSANWHRAKRKKMREAGTGYIHKTPVFGLLQRGGKVHTEMLKKATGKTIKPIILNKVKDGSLVMTDGFGAYTGLNKTYKHEVVNHQQGEYVRGDFHTNGIEGYWSQLKRGIYGVYHQVSPKYLHRYCSAFSFRYNTRENTVEERFNLAIKNSVDGRLRYDKLIRA